MATHTLHGRSGGSVVGLAPAWTAPAAAWPAATFDGDTGTVTQAAIGAGHSSNYIAILGLLLDDLAIPSSAVVNAIDLSLNYAITAPAGNSGAISIDAGAASAVWSGNASGSLSQHINLVGSGTTWADVPSLGSLSIQFNCDNSAQSGGSMRLVISSYTAVIDYTPAATPPKDVKSVYPVSGASTGGQQVTIAGDGFTGATRVLFDGLDATSVVVRSDTTLTCVTPAHAIGAVDVTVLGVDTLAAAFRYEETNTDGRQVINQGAAALLPPVPKYAAPVDGGMISTTWLRWFNTLKAGVDAIRTFDASHVLSGVFGVDQIPTLPWSKVSKAGSSLADLETSDAGALTQGTIRDARLADTAVTPGSYGDATHSASITVDQKGRITAASQSPITSLPATAAKGDMLASNGSAFGVEPVGANGNILTADSSKTRGVTWASPPSGTVPGTATKGDILASNGSAFVVRHPGADGTVLTADSSQSDGVKWAAAGALVLLEEHTAAASSQLDFTAWQSATYDDYQIEIVNIVNGSSAIPRIRCSTNGGVSYDSGANYDWGYSFHYSGAPGSIFGASDTAILWRDTATTLAANGSWDGFLKLKNPGGALFKKFLGELAVQDNGAGLLFVHGGGQYKSTSAVNALRFDMSTGTFSGTIRIYGVAK